MMMPNLVNIVGVEIFQYSNYWLSPALAFMSGHVVLKQSEILSGSYFSFPGHSCS